MKFSKDLLNDKDLGKRLYNGTIEKTNKFLKEIFDIDVDSHDSRIKNINNDPDNYRYGMILKFQDRSIGVGCSYDAEEDENDIVTEVLNIVEVETEKINITDLNNKSYNEIADAAQTFLENKYGLNFTPIDPDVKDTKILSIEEKPDSFIWKALFTQPQHEGHYEAQLCVDDGQAVNLNIIKNKRHKIYLD